MPLAVALALLPPLLAPGDTRREAWPDGTPRAEYEVVVRPDGREERSGPYRSWHSNGALESEGAFAEDRETGRWRFHFPDGTRAAEGSYARGQRVGMWESFHASGKRASKGRYEKGARTGSWSFWDAAGALNAVDSGEYAAVELRLADGRVLAGERVDGEAHGPWRCSWPDGTPMLAGALVRGRLHGPWKLHRPDGTVSASLSAEYEHGRRVGPIAPEASEELARPPSPPGPPGPRPEDDELEREIERWIGADPEQLDELRRDVRPAWIAAGLRSLPIALRRLLRCDPLADRDTISRIDQRILRPLAGGHALVALPAPPDVEQARSYQDAWATLWAATHEDAWFWCVELPLRSVAAPDVVLLERPLERFLATLAPAPERPALLAKRFEERPKRSGAPLDAALAWLETSQLADGRWSSGVGLEKPHDHHDVGVTALALLALLGAGRTPEQTRAIAAGVGWLLAQQSATTGELPARRVTHDWIYDHLLATIALCEAEALAPSAHLAPRVQRAVDVVFDAQNPGAGWRYDRPPNGESDTSVTAWAVAALFVAREAGLEGDFEAAFRGARAWIDRTTDADLGRIGYDALGTLSARTPANERFPRELGEAMTAAGLFVRRLLGAPAADPLVEKHVALLGTKPPRWDPKGLAVDEYYFYYGAHALALCGALDRTRWDDGLAEIARAQSGNAAVRGSWDPVGVWSLFHGRVGTTALLALALEAPFRYAPAELASATDARERRRK